MVSPHSSSMYRPQAIILITVQVLVFHRTSHASQLFFICQIFNFTLKEQKFSQINWYFIGMDTWAQKLWGIDKDSIGFGKSHSYGGRKIVMKKRNTVFTRLVVALEQQSRAQTKFLFNSSRPRIVVSPNGHQEILRRPKFHCPIGQGYKHQIISKSPYPL